MAVPARDDPSVTVEIRLLGPVEVANEARVVPLCGARQRTLVAALALRAPDVVSRESLIDAVWDAHPPCSAAKTLRAHVAYLRRNLRAGGAGGLVVTRPSGYALAAPARCVDAHRFEDLVASARAAPAPEATAERLRAALGLWCGDVLAGCAAGDWLRAEATRLNEVRLCATEELFTAELDVGRHARVIAELEALVARHSLRERLWELLMRALYRSGRRADALRAYRRARSRLVAELGLEPGAELQRLEAAILTGAEDIAVPPTAGMVAAPRTDLPEARQAPEVDETPGTGRQAAQDAVPTPLTNLVGRRAAIAELSDLLPQRRLVTLTGVGGCGKTRLAIAVAAAVDGRYADGVRFVDLTPLADGDLVAGMVAAALGVPADPDGVTVDALTGYLGPRQCLLVLDNCEHLVRSCAHLVATLLRSCPDLRVLATSRETLGVLGEVAWPVPPLPTPRGEPDEHGERRGLDGVRRYDAVRLFLDRATVATVRGLTDADAAAIAAVCTRLDGLPLAIELAAARTAVLTVAEIADRLHDPALLCHPPQHPDRPHHRALDSTIAWSYDLLDPPTRARFRRLAVFTGGFTLAAAEAVWPGGERPPCATVDVLADLVAKSLVVMERHRTGARYRLLETIGRWAAARLAEDADAERDARRRHAAHYLALAEEAHPKLRGPEMAGWLDRLAAEHENLRSALAWFAGAGRDPAGQLRLAVALAQYCVLRDRYADGRRWLEDALGGATASVQATAELVGQALWATAGFAMLMCDYGDAQRLAGRALVVHREAGDDPGVARAFRLLASIAQERGDYVSAFAALDQARSVLGTGDRAAGSVLHQVGFTCWLSGDLDRAEHALDAALRHHERFGSPVSVSSVQIHLAAVALYRGRPDLAEQIAGECLDRFTELDFKQGIGWACNIIGLAALRRGRREDAVAALRTSLEMHRTVGDRWRQASVLEALAEAFLAGGDPVRAAELTGLAAAIRGALGVRVPAQERPACEQTQAALRRCLPDGERRAAAARGAATPVVEVIASLATFACAAVH